MTKVDIEVVDIRKINGDGNLKAFADVKIADCVVVKGFSVLQGKKGVFVSMPKKAGKDGRWFEIITPLHDDTREKLQNIVMEAYDRQPENTENG